MNTEENNTQFTQSSVSVSVTELRIGNLIDCFGECEVIGITERKIKVRRKSESGTRFLIEKIPKSSLSLKPLIITESKLLENGFIEEDYAGGCFSKNGISIDMDDFNCVVKTKWLDIEVKHFHKLQNLHFSLYNVELQDVVLTEH